ncbi:SlyX family protein [Pseudoponticoccus marisrubri]|uniref:SlyX protein n=1 Tax=Pseudoponticoccus marisrubri TaxID=1685382 RepID=A0A0W7WGU8_9RHOB|nr:SlyX family protein [Pseudoponticoccus marisrubri]KUF09794.1 SlyX protein [Pseudoponticoccus marisrubri]
MSTDRDALETRLAFLERSLEDLSDTVVVQQREIERLTRRVALLMAREAERESEGGGGLVLGDERPPHY